MKFLLPRQSPAAFVLLSAALMFWIPAALAQTTTPADQPGPLNIHVTAVQGAAQFRPDSNAKWKSVAVNADLPEGVEFRTGPKGTIQFTIGSDQVFRVDRLTVVKILRANLNADGTIRTDVGMTYGRVSKDVDLPSHPHEDTIITPSSTLAIRGTQVSMYDQPPFTPQAQSLTGNALYHPKGGPQFSFGSKGGGTNTVSPDAVGAAQFQLTSNIVAPTGNFAGLTGPELQNVQNNPGGPPPGPAGNISQHTGQIVGGMANTTQVVPSSTSGLLAFQFEWMGNFSETIVNMQIQAPGGAIVTSINPPSPTIGGPNFVGSRVANRTIGDQSAIAGIEQFAYGNVTTSSFANGNYKVTLQLIGTTLQPLSEDPTISVTGILSAIEVPPGAGIGNTARPRLQAPSSLESQSGQFPLNFTNSTATFNISPPIPQGGHFTGTFSH